MLGSIEGTKAVMDDGGRLTISRGREIERLRKDDGEFTLLPLI